MESKQPARHIGDGRKETAKRLRSLEEENGKLKQLLADTMLDNAAFNELLPVSWTPR